MHKVQESKKLCQRPNKRGNFVRNDAVSISFCSSVKLWEQHRSKPQNPYCSDSKKLYKADGCSIRWRHLWSEWGTIYSSFFPTLHILSLLPYPITSLQDLAWLLKGLVYQIKFHPKFTTFMYYSWHASSRCGDSDNKMFPSRRRI